MIEFKNVSYNYEDGKTILKNVSFELPNKGIVYLKGKSGSGKTTILNLIAGLEKINCGEICYNGSNINKIKNYQSYISYVPSENALISFLDVKNNILFSTDKKIDEKVLKKLNINDLLPKKVFELSGGEVKRVDIVRSIFNNQSVILLDEPFNSLDNENNYKILDIIKEISKSKLVIITSHKETIVENIADVVLLINNQNINIKIKNNDIYNERRNNNIVEKPRKKEKIFIKNLLLNSRKKVLSYIVIMSLCFLVLLTLININETKESLNAKLLIQNKLYTTYIYDDINDDVVVQVYSNDNFRFDTIEPINTSIYYQKVKDNLYIASINNFNYLKDISGRLPQNDTEIIISKYLADCLKYYGIIKEDNILNKEIIFNDTVFKIVGIYNQNLDIFYALKSVSPGYKNSEISNLESMFYDGVVSKNIIYFTDSYIKSLDDNTYEFSIYFNKDYYKLKNIIKKYHTEDMYSNQVDNYLNTFKIIKNVTYPLILMMIFMILLIDFYIIKSIFEEYYKDFDKLKYYNFIKKDRNKVLFKITISIIIISYFISLVFSNLLVVFLNDYIVKSNNLLINIFYYNYLYVLLILVINIIINKLYILINYNYKK